jgi:Pyruvate/2-oxoglutarate dehydrogenase complex, dihydrolipoamide dehydrogenase (E3) component, and related enzymes
MHNAALIKEHILNSRDFGWDLDELNNEEAHEKDTLFKEFEWKTLVRNVQLHIKSINFEYTSTLKENGTPYVNNLASLLDRNTIVYSANRDYLKEFAQSGSFNGEKLGKLTADYIIIATGGRPRLLTEKECKNGEKYSITSDDIFSLQTPPNKTLVVGGGYIALECAGFLSTIGYPVTLMNRTDTFLRGILIINLYNSKVLTLTWLD